VVLGIGYCAIHGGWVVLVPFSQGFFSRKGVKKQRWCGDWNMA
jgi:hypothetical protein